MRGEGLINERLALVIEPNF